MFYRKLNFQFKSATVKNFFWWLVIKQFVRIIVNSVFDGSDSFWVVFFIPFGS